MCGSSAVPKTRNQLYAYEILNLDPSAPIETQTPDELLACWERLTPDDRAILIRWARLLAATDLPKALSHEVRGVMTWEKSLVLTRANQVRRRRLGLPEDPEDEQ
jgi:hypothetical protein